MKRFQVNRLFVFSIICSVFLVIGFGLYQTQAQEAKPKERVLDVEIGTNDNTEPGGQGTAAPQPQYWKLLGNAIQSGHFLGTTNNLDLIFKTNKVEALRITAAGNVGIGTTGPTGRLHVAGTGNVIFSQSGNVGIGTTSPLERLDVAGTIRMTGFKLPTGAIDGYVLTSDANGIGTWKPASGGGGIGGNGIANFIPKFTDATTLGNSNIYETSGNVGIGTTEPGQKLHILGSGTGGTGLLVNGNAGNGYIADFRYPGTGTGGIRISGYSDGSKAADFYNLDDSTLTIGKTDGVTTGVLTLKSSGNVGIGTTSPYRKLSIVSGSNSISALEVKAATNIVAGKGSPSSSIAFTAPNYADGYNLMAGIAAESGDDTWPDRGQLAFKTGYMSVLEGLTTKMVLDFDGKLGIGTTRPQGTLDVKAHTDGWAGGLTLTASDGLSKWRIHPDTTATQGLMFSENDTNARMVIARGTGNVGIGTESPAAKLDVAGTVKATAFNLNGNEITSWPSGGGSDNLGNHTATQNIQLEGHWLSGDGGNEGVFVTGTGDVGIGTTSPGAKLEVAGQIKITGGSPGAGKVLTSDDSGLATWKTPSGGGNGITQLNAGTGISLSPNPITTTGAVSVATEGITTVHIKDGTITTSDLSFTPLTNPFNGSLTVNGPGGSINAMTGNTNGDFAGVAGLNSGIGPGIYGESYATESNVGAVTGKAKRDGGSGVYGQTFSLGKSGGSSVGVFGWAAETGEAVGGAALGVMGRVSSYKLPNTAPSMPSGVFGEANATQGISAGVTGEAYSPVGPSPGVYGVNRATSGSTRGVWGEVKSPNGVAVFGRNESNSPGTKGGDFQNAAGTFANIAYWDGTKHYGVKSNGIIEAADFVKSSDVRLKKEIVSIHNALERVTQLRGVNYRWIDDEKGNGLQMGVIAQEVEAIFPEVVSTDNEGYKSVAYGDLVAVLIEAVKEQQKEIEELKATVKSLAAERQEAKNKSVAEQR